MIVAPSAMNDFPISRRKFVAQVSSAAALALAPKIGRGLDRPAGRKLGVALVGLGYYSTHELAPALRLTHDCELAGVVTGDREKGVKWSQEYGFPEASVYSYDTMARMADNPAIDIVYVVTPNGLHAEHCIAAAKAGKHVICEKPMANTVAECDSIIAACHSAGVRLSIGYRLHYDPLHEELRRLARTKEFGRFMQMKGNFSFKMDREQWRARKKLAGGGPLMDLGVYVIQESCMAANAMPVAVTARELPKKRPEFFLDVEESLEWTMEFPAGERSECYTSYNDTGDNFRAEAKDGWYEVGPAFGYRNLKAATSQGPVTATPPASQQALQMDAFAHCVLSGRPSIVPAEMGRRDVVIIEAIYAAAASGKRVEIKI